MRSKTPRLALALLISGCYQISNVPNPKTCPDGSASRFDGSAWQCESVPQPNTPGMACETGQVIAWNATTSTWVCQSLPASAPLPSAACPVGTASQWSGVQWQCVTVPQPTLPTCNQTQAVTWNNGAWGCAPLPAPYPVPPGNCTAGVTWNSATSSWACQDSDAIIPPGTVIAYAGDVVNPPPTGWLWCNGDPFPTSQPYTALFNVIGTTYGSAAGNPPGFRVPDYRGYFLRGFDSTGNVDPGPRVALTSGAIPGTGSIETQDFKSHTHPFAANVFGGTAMGLADSMLGMPTGMGQVFLQGATAAAGGLETRPTNISVNYLIKY